MSETPEKSVADGVKAQLESQPRLPSAPLAEPVSPIVEEAVGAGAGRSPAQSARAARLASALRDNLRRRKAPRAARTPSGN